MLTVEHKAEGINSEETNAPILKGKIVPSPAVRMEAMSKPEEIEKTPEELEAERLQKIANDKVFEEELLPFIDALHNFAYNLCFNTTEANDLVQETYLKAYRFINSFQSGTNAKAWLFKILKNVYINQYRKKSRRPSAIDIDEVNVYSESDKDRTQLAYLDLRKELFDEMLGDEVTIALNSLPVEFRTVILLCDIENFSYEEIAKIIEKPIGTVRSRLFRARNMLKEKLKNYALELGYADVRGAKNKTA